MSFVQWVTAAALLVVALGGAYAGVVALVRRKVEVPPYTVEGKGAVLMALLYFAGGVCALAAFLLLFISTFS